MNFGDEIVVDNHIQDFWERLIPALISIIECLTSSPLCFATQNIGEVSRSDGGVEKTRLCLFILLSSEKNDLRSSGSYRAIRLVATVAVGVCGTRSARTVLALFPPSSLRLHRPIKAGI